MASLNIKQVFLNREGKRWTEEEIIYLENIWGKYTISQVAHKMGRSVTAIKIKAGRMSLGYSYYYGNDISILQLITALGIKSSYGQFIEMINLYSDFPVKIRKSDNNEYRMINVDDWWLWSKKHKNILNFSKFKKGMLGKEPEWVDIKRKADKINPSKTNHNKPWTKADDNLLKSKLKQYKYTYKDLSEYFNRTEAAIKRHIRDLELKDKPISLDNHVKWTQTEKNLLKEMYDQGYSSFSIAKKLNKSQMSVTDRINAIKYNKEYEINSYRKWTLEEKLYVKNNLDVEDHVVGKALKRSIMSIKKAKKRIIDKEWDLDIAI